MSIAAYLSKHCLTDSDFANLVGVSRATVSRWRRGKTRPHWGQIARIIEVSNGQISAGDFVPPVHSVHEGYDFSKSELPEPFPPCVSGD